MHRELVTLEPRKIGYLPYEDRDPAGDEVLVETTVSGIKHGTELNMYRGTLPFAEELFDLDARLFRPPRPEEKIAPFFPHTMGSWAAGVVRRVGPAVRSLRPGDAVHGEWKHRETVIKPEGVLYRIPPGVDGETMVFSDPARFALAAVHDAQIKLGDRVAIFGMGAIGLLAVQMARLNGALHVLAVDPIARRRELALQVGAQAALDPSADDVGLVIKEASGGQGVDVALEISGVYSALQHAIRCVRREGLVVTASYYGDAVGRVDLAREWHHNRVTMRSSMPVWGCSHRCYPLWDMERLERTAIALLEQGHLAVEPLIGARIPFARAAEAYTLIDQSPADAVKVVLTYGQAGT